MPNAYISGVGGYVPPRVVTNDDLIAMGVETTDAWIQQRTGIRERRFADDGVGNADLALPAARAAIDDAGLAPTDIDMILYATLSPDQCFPGSGVMLAEKLGLCAGEDATFVPAMDIRNQCSGFVYGLGTAASLIQSGACQHVLVVGSEVHSGGLDFTTRGRTVASLFGDGAGAAVFSATEEDRGVRYWKCGSDGRFADVLCQRTVNLHLVLVQLRHALGGLRHRLKDPLSAKFAVRHAGLALTERLDVGTLLALARVPVLIEHFLSDLESSRHGRRFIFSNLLTLDGRSNFGTLPFSSSPQAPRRRNDVLHDLGVPSIFVRPALERPGFHDEAIRRSHAVGVRVAVVSDESARAKPRAHVALNVMLWAL